MQFTFFSRFKKAGQSAGMSIIDVGILTGFSVDKDSLIEVNFQALDCQF